MNDQKTDSELLRLVKTSDAEAFRELFERYQPLTFRHVLFLIRDTDAAHDIVQEAFLRIWNHRASLQPHLSFLAYALRIGENLVRDAARHRKIRERFADVLPPPHLSEGDDPLEALQLAQTREHIMAVIEQKLPSRCRMVFLLSRFEEKSNAEIAALLGVSVKTVENQIHHALKVLRRELGHTRPET